VGLLLSPLSNVATSALVEGVGFVARLCQRRSTYELARCRADRTGKPLVVVGAPTACRHGVVSGSLAQYRCGDLPCVDLEGCAACGAPPTDLERPGAIAVEDGGAVVCVQYVLEYVGDVEAAWREVCRAAGSPRDVLVSRVQGWAPGTRVLTGCRRLLDPPSSRGELSYYETRRPGRGTVRGVGRRLL
jgi:hypothetical protein